MRKPVKANDRAAGPYPYYGANGQQGTIDGYIFDEPLLLLAEDGGHFDEPERGIAYRISGKSWVNNHAHVLRMTPALDLNYASAALANMDVRKYVTGTTRAKLTKAGAARIEIPLPPLDEQRRIAAILDQADDLREKRRRVLDRTGKLSQSLFVDLFGDPIRNPRNLPVVPLGGVGVLDRGVSRHRPRNDPALLGGPYPLIQTGDVARSGGLITDYSATYSEQGLAQSKLWPVGTLCITIAANIAQTGVLAFDACFPDSVVGFTADHATTAYVRMWLTFLQPVLEASAPQSAQRNINLAILRGLPVPLPSKEEQEAFDRLLRKVQDQQQLNLEAQDRDADLFTALQARAFSEKL
jgi:type I restriction enzyme S subunit